MTPPRRPGPPAAYDLKEVFRLLPDARVANGKATQEVKKRCATRRRMTDEEAQAYVLQLVGSLTPDAFVRTDVLVWHDDAKADVYGAQNEDGDWYVKLYIGEGGELLVIVSCHEPQGTMRRSDGRSIGKPRK